MKWTKDPQSTGRYWARRAGTRSVELVEVRWFEMVSDATWAVYSIGSENEQSFDDFDLWYGPLQPPPFPL